jgi:hypothetical protein
MVSLACLGRNLTSSEFAQQNPPIAEGPALVERGMPLAIKSGVKKRHPDLSRLAAPARARSPKVLLRLHLFALLYLPN